MCNAWLGERSRRASHQVAFQVEKKAILCAFWAILWWKVIRGCRINNIDADDRIAVQKIWNTFPNDPIRSSLFKTFNWVFEVDINLPTAYQYCRKWVWKIFIKAIFELKTWIKYKCVIFELMHLSCVDPNTGDPYSMSYAHANCPWTPWSGQLATGIWLSSSFRMRYYSRFVSNAAVGRTDSRTWCRMPLWGRVTISFHLQQRWLWLGLHVMLQLRLPWPAAAPLAATHPCCNENVIFYYYFFLYRLSSSTWH